MGDLIKTAIMIDFSLNPVRQVIYSSRSYNIQRFLKWPGISVLTVITVVAVLPAIAEIATIAVTP